MSRQARTRRLLLLAGVLASSMMFTTGSIKADDSNCRDIAMVFARGSGQNPDNLYTDDTQGDDFRRVEPEAYHFFDWQKQYITKHYPHVSFKAVSIHDFPGQCVPSGGQPLKCRGVVDTR